MRTNIILKRDAALLREIEKLAAEKGTSVNALPTSRLEQMVRESKTYDHARKRALSRLEEGLDMHWTPFRSRNELHER